jgi:NAD-dependent dihydropyrimidine dehydrogenase PreA subunit
MEYTIVKQVIGEVDIKHFKTAEEMDKCISAICLEMCEEGVRYKSHRVHQDRWGARLLYEVHAEDGCIYSVFRNETNE